jgi:hypothetical protein
MSARTHRDAAIMRRAGDVTPRPFRCDVTVLLRLCISLFFVFCFFRTQASTSF